MGGDEVEAERVQTNFSRIFFVIKESEGKVD